MTTGAVIFAQNNASIDYIKLAIFAASKIQEHLDIPVSIITDSKNYLLKAFPNHTFDKIIEIGYVEETSTKQFYDGALSSKSLVWKNHNRTNIFNLTPYDRTLVIDSDYIINSDILKSALDNDYEFQIYQSSFDLAFERNNSEFQRINQYTIPFFWATVFIFQKTTVMELFFNLITQIKENWQYYRLLYNITSNTYRNDFAFSIAIHIMGGKMQNDFAIELPGKMVYAMDTDVLISADGVKMKFITQKKDHLGEYLVTKTNGLDVHVMNKLSLSRFIDGGSGV